MFSCRLLLSPCQAAILTVNKDFDLSLGAGYKSKAQKVRVMSEAWVENNIVCPACGSALQKVKNNSPVKDFHCAQCPEQFELKSSGKKWGRKIMAGAYAAMRKRLQSPQPPSFFFLHYKETAAGCRVENFFCLPKQFFTANIIEKRCSLRATARRARWVGCKILVDKLPESGKIFYMRDNICAPDADVRRNFAKIRFLNAQKTEAKSWLIDVMKQIELLAQRRFSLTEFYAKAEADLQKKHPDNNNVKAKIRQQLQTLRDQGYLSFKGGGIYELC
ncbi:MAG: restriction endonuclease [Candidatus Tokpelaia sp.]|nr:MAG: restriction endonuclease [Candidatus Tokpelaia sp.]